MKKETESGVVFGDKEICGEGTICACRTCYLLGRDNSFNLIDGSSPDLFSRSAIYKILDTRLIRVHCDKGRVRSALIAMLLESRLKKDDREFDDIYAEFSVKYGVSGWRGMHRFMRKYWKEFMDYKVSD